MDASRVKPLTEFCMRTIIGNLDSVSSLGSLPYRLARPILMQCDAEKIMEIERASPHLRDDDQEVWRDLCIKKFDDVRRDHVKEDFQSPKSWRKYYHVTLAKEKQMEEDAGSRIRNKYQALQARKEERQTIFTADRIPPMKRSRTWGQAAPPKSLFQKARSQASKQANVYSATPPIQRPSSSAAVSIGSKPSAPSVGSSSASLRTAQLMFPPSSSNPSPITITTTTKVVQPGNRRLSTMSGSMSPPPLPDHLMSPPPIHQPLAAISPPPTQPSVRRPPPNSSALFMPKHKSSSQLPSRSRP